MKKFISVLCVVAIMLGISVPAMAVSAWTSELTSEFTVYDNFDGYYGGIAKHTIEGAAWSKSGDGVPVEGGKVTVSSATKATNTMVDLNTAITSDYAVIDFDFNITTANENNTALFYIKDSSNKDITRIQAQYKNGAMYLYTYKGGTESDKTTNIDLVMREPEKGLRIIGNFNSENVYTQTQTQTQRQQYGKTAFGKILT